MTENITYPYGHRLKVGYKIKTDKATYRVFKVLTSNVVAIQETRFSKLKNWIKKLW